MEFVKLLDFFGVLFQFRMENYKPFTSKTGGVNFIIYIMICIMISFYYISEFFDSSEPKNHSKSEAEKFALGETINLKNESFTFAIKYPNTRLFENGPHLKDILNITVLYKASNSFDVDKNKGRIYNRTKIPEKKCLASDFDTEEEKSVNLFEDMKCFDFTAEQKVFGFYYSPYFSFFKILVNLNLRPEYASYLTQTFQKNKVWISLVYPKNVVDNYNKVNKFSSTIYYLFSADSQISSNFYVKKKTFIEDDAILFNYPKKLVIGDYETHETTHSFLDFNEKNSTNSTNTEQITIGKLYIRQFFTSVTSEKKRLKLIILVAKINSLLINVFLIFKVFVSVVNLKKAKKHLLENVFYINTHNETDKKHQDEYQLQTNPTLKDLKATNTGKRDENKFFIIDNEIIKRKLFANKESSFLEYNKKNKNAKSVEPEVPLETEVEIQLDDLKDKYDEKCEDNQTATKDSLFESTDPAYSGNLNKTEESLKDIIKVSLDNDLKNQMLAKNNDNEGNNKKGLFLNDNSNNNNNKMNFIKDGKRIPHTPSGGLKKNFTDFYTIKHMFSINKERNRKTNLRSLIKMLLCCNFVRLKKVNQIYSFAEEKFDDFVNIKKYIKRMQEIESLKTILFNDDGQALFDFVSRPRFSIIFDENNDIVKNKCISIPKLPCQGYQEKLYGNFVSINNKPCKNELEMKLMERFMEKIN